MTTFFKGHIPETVLLILTLIVGISMTKLADVQPVISDSLGYIVAGQQLSKGYGLRFVDEHNTSAGPFFYLHAFRMVGDPSEGAVFGYPPGFPVLIAAGIWLSQNSQAAHYVVPLLATLAIPLTYLLGWMLSENKWVGLWSAFILACTTTFAQFSTAAWSEVPSLVCLVGGIGFYLYSRQPNHSAFAAFAASTIGAVLIGFSFFIRFTNAILVIPPLIVYEVYTTRGDFLKRKSQWYFFIVIGLFAGGVLLYNLMTFGGPFKSIYNAPELGAYPWPYFSLQYAFGPSPVDGYSFLRALETVWDNYSILLFLAPVGLLSLARSNAIVSIGIIITTMTLYSIYAFAPTAVNARFLLPMFPFLSISIAAGWVALGERYLKPRWRLLLSLVLIGFLLFPVYQEIQEIQQRNLKNAAMVNHTTAITSQVPDNSVWLSTSWNDLVIVYGEQAALNYRRMLVADPNTGRFDRARVESCLVQTVDRLLADDIPVFYVMDPGEQAATILKEHFLLAPVPFAEGTFAVSAPAENNNRPDVSKCLK